MTNQEIKELAGHREVPPWVMKLVADAVQRERDELFVMFMEAHQGAKDSHNHWHVAANKIKERNK